MSMGSPPAVAAAAPFNAYGTMQNLLTSHMQKVSASQFDDSVEMRSPLKRQIGERWGEVTWLSFDPFLWLRVPGKLHYAEMDSCVLS